MIAFDALCGLDETAIVDCAGVAMHREVLPHWETLTAAASAAGFDLRAASGYRSFDRQLAIWNAKACGQRPLLDRDEQPLDCARLTPVERLWAILHWSALPGGSRHHWGTELDIYDANSLPDGYQLQLTVAETQPGGVMAEFYLWLDEYLPSSAFFRPYYQSPSQPASEAANHARSGCATQGAGSGVAAEPWHLSCGPISATFSEAQSPTRLHDFIASREDLLLRDEILAHFDEIYANYIAL